MRGDGGEAIAAGGGGPASSCASHGLAASSSAGAGWRVVFGRQDGREDLGVAVVGAGAAGAAAGAREGSEAAASRGAPSFSRRTRLFDL